MKDIALRKDKNIVTRTIGGETILLPICKSSDDLNCIYTLNSVAPQVWILINGKRKLSEITAEVPKKFDTTRKEADKEMKAFLNELKKIKAIV